MRISKPHTSLPTWKDFYIPNLKSGRRKYDLKENNQLVGEEVAR